MFNSQSTPKQQDLLLHMDAYTAMGPHGIHLRILKMLLMSRQNLSMIFEQVWESGRVPADWKLANVPVFNIREDPENHRPVSLTSVPSQVMEEMILGSTEKHLEDNAGISHSFVKGKSCLFNLISFCDRVTHLTDLGKPVVTLLDFTKTLNIVSPSDLLDKQSSPQLVNHVK